MASCPGIEDLATLQAYQESELKSLGMKGGHVKKLLRAMDKVVPPPSRSGGPPAPTRGCGGPLKAGASRSFGV
jgi:hypothetical protein